LKARILLIDTMEMIWQINGIYRAANDCFSSAIACPPSRAAQARQAWSAEKKVSVSLCASVANRKILCEKVSVGLRLNKS
jgi:hypothetical protein